MFAMFVITVVAFVGGLNIGFEKGHEFPKENNFFTAYDKEAK